MFPIGRFSNDLCKARKVRGLAWLFLLLLIPEKTNAQSLAREHVDMEQTMLVLQADAPCRVAVDGAEVAQLDAGETRRVPIEAGERKVEAMGEHPDDRWEKTVHVEPGRQRVVAIRMNHVIKKRKAKQVNAAEIEQEREEKSRLLALAKASLFDDASYVRIPAGHFERRGEGSVPTHTVIISRTIEMGLYEVTQAQWEAVMGFNPSSEPGPFNPVESVSWYQVQAFMDSLNSFQEGPLLYRLPTEAEWEYACVAGSRDGTPLQEKAWYAENAGEKHHPVGQKARNEWGIHDMRGNVWEWVQDWYGLYDPEIATDPQSGEEGRSRVIRGGSWWSPADITTCSHRGNLAPDYKATILGFRIVREYPPAPLP